MKSINNYATSTRKTPLCRRSSRHTVMTSSLKCTISFLVLSGYTAICAAHQSKLFASLLLPYRARSICVNLIGLSVTINPAMFVPKPLFRYRVSVSDVGHMRVQRRICVVYTKLFDECKTHIIYDFVYVLKV